MKQVIRKLSVGSGSPANNLHFQVGKDYILSGKRYEIVHINKDPRDDIEVYNIFIKGDKETLLWKRVVGMPVIVESNIDFK